MTRRSSHHRSDGRPSFGLIVHHTDGEREFAYDRQHVVSGRLDQRLDEAPATAESSPT
jgi:hypothetical protein